MRTLIEKSLFPATKPSSVPKGVAREKHPKTISGELSETPLRRERLDTCPRAEGAAKVGQHLRAMGQACHTGILLFFPSLSPLQKSIAQLIQGSGVGRDMQSCPSDHGPEYGEGVSYVMCGADWT